MNCMTPELVVDSFAGGGGASLGIELALGRSPDIAINHDAEALAMHAANHPTATHLPHNVWKVDPVAATGGRPVGLLWASPDCKHHSKAKGGKPVKREIRDLAWVVVRWAKQVRPRIIMLENVEEFRDWGPLDVDGRPCKERKGKTFDAWVGELRRLGYKVEWRELRACDFGAPTIRKRLFLIARRDGRKIVWPTPTHGKPGTPDVLSGKLLPWRTAAEIIDWTIACPSIFLTREEGRAIGVNRPLAPNTMARIAKGVKRYVIDAAEPFIVPVTHQGDSRVNGVDEPLRTVTTAKRGEHAIVTPFMVPRYGERTGQEPRTRAIDEPAATIVPTANGGSLVAVYMAQHNEGNVGRAIDDPLSTIVHRGTQQSIVAAHITKFSENSIGHRPDEPLHTAMAGAPRHGLVAAFLAQHNTDMVGHDAREPVSTIVGKGCTQAVVSAGLVNMKGSQRSWRSIDEPAPTVCAGTVHAAEVRAFLIKYYGNENDGIEVRDPMHTVTTKDRFGLVSVHGETYEIVDIGMRMLTPRELFFARKDSPIPMRSSRARRPTGRSRSTRRRRSGCAATASVRRWRARWSQRTSCPATSAIVPHRRRWTFPC